MHSVHGFGLRTRELGARREMGLAAGYRELGGREGGRMEFNCAGRMEVMLLIPVTSFFCISL